MGLGTNTGLQAGTTSTCEGGGIFSEKVPLFPIDPSSESGLNVVPSIKSERNAFTVSDYIFNKIINDKNTTFLYLFLLSLLLWFWFCFGSFGVMAAQVGFGLMPSAKTVRVFFSPLSCSSSYSSTGSPTVIATQSFL